MSPPAGPIDAGDPATASVLAFQGGGFLAYFSALMAGRIEEMVPGRQPEASVAGHFDLLAGTSAGSIIAAGLAAGLTASAITRIMQQNGEKIFPRRKILATAPGILGARFSPKPLRDILTANLGDRRLGDLDHALLIPTINESLRKPEIFRSYDPDQAHISVVDVVLASAAAPTYLPRHKIGDHHYADGALVANGPALLAAHDLSLRFRIPFNAQRIVTIGTTMSPPQRSWRQRFTSWGVGGWFAPPPRLLELMLGGQVELQAELLAGLAPMELVTLDDHLTPEEARHVHMVLADARARKVLEDVAGRCADGVPPETRDKLHRILSRRRRHLAFEDVPGTAAKRPALIRRPETPPHPPA